MSDRCERRPLYIDAIFKTSYIAGALFSSAHLKLPDIVLSSRNVLRQNSLAAFQAMISVHSWCRLCGHQNFLRPAHRHHKRPPSF